MDWLSEYNLILTIIRTGGIEPAVSTANCLQFDFEDYLSRMLENLQTNVERIAYEKLTKTAKSNDESSKLRDLGNKWFSSSESDAFDKALEFYTKSIAYALPQSEEMALSYANRSTVLLNKMNRPEESLQDIERALPNYPEHLKPKLYMRMAECYCQLASECKVDAKIWLDKLPKRDVHRIALEEMLKDYPKKKLKDWVIDDECVLPAIKNRSKRYSCASDAVEVQHSEEFGRHVVAARNIDVGEVLIVEKPYFRFLDKSNLYTHCSYCTTSLWNGIPCEKCVNAVYCSMDCKAKAWIEFHRMECTVSDLVMQYDYQDYQGNCLRLLLQMHHEAGGLQQLKKRVTKICGDNFDAFHAEVEDEWYQGTKLESILCLLSQEDKVTQEEWGRLSFVTLRIMFLLLTSTNFFGIKFEREDTFDKDIIGYMTKDSNFSFIGRLIIKLNYIILRNSYGFIEAAGNGINTRGKATAGLISLLNHSCHPSTSLQCKRNHIVAHALFPIKKGEQIFSTYYQPAIQVTILERQQFLEKNFHFKCNCIACREKWFPDSSKLNEYYKNIEKLWGKARISHIPLLDLSKRVLSCGHYDERHALLSNLHKISRIIYKKLGANCGEMMLIIHIISSVHFLTGNVKKSSKPIVPEF